MQQMASIRATESSSMKDMESSQHIIKRIGVNVARICDQVGMTQSELSRRADVDRSHLNGLLCGNRNVSIDFLVKVANGLDVPIARFFEGLDEASPMVLLQDLEPTPTRDYDSMRWNY